MILSAGEARRQRLTAATTAGPLRSLILVFGEFRLDDAVPSPGPDELIFGSRKRQVLSRVMSPNSQLARGPSFDEAKRRAAQRRHQQPAGGDSGFANIPIVCGGWRREELYDTCIDMENSRQTRRRGDSSS